MPHWPSNDEKITSQNNFKLKFSKNSLDLARGSLFEYSVI